MIGAWDSSCHLARFEIDISGIDLLGRRSNFVVLSSEFAQDFPREILDFEVGAQDKVVLQGLDPHGMGWVWGMLHLCRHRTKL